VRIGLVADVPHQAIVRGVEYVVQGDREFDRAEVRRKMSAGPGYRFHQEAAQLVGELRQLLALKFAYLRWIADGVE
jgi:hypothetical protein